MTRVGIDATVLNYNNEGIGNYLRGVLRGLQEIRSDEFRFTVFVHSDEEGLSRTAYDGMAEIVEVPKYEKLSGFRLALEIARLARRLRLEVLISTHNHLLPIFFNRTWQLVHDIGPILHPEYFNINHSFFFKFFFERGIRPAQKILTTTETVAAELNEHYQLDSVITIGFGAARWTDKTINQNQSTLEKIKKSANSADKARKARGGYFLAIGTLSPRKNYEYMIKEFAQFLARRSVISTKNLPKLLISGKPGWDFDSIYATIDGLAENYPELDIDWKNQIQLVGFTPDVEVNELTNAAIALIASSKYEGLGMPPFEALKLGTPVILSDIPVFKELYAEVGHFFSLEPGQLATKLEDFLRLEPDKQYNEKLVIELNKKYNWHETSGKLLYYLREAKSS